VKDAAARETIGGWLVLAVGTATVLVAPLLLIVLTSYVQLSPLLSGYDIGLEEPAPPLDLIAVIFGVFWFLFEAIVSVVVVFLASLWIRVEKAIAFIGVPLLASAAIAGLWRLSAIGSVVLLLLSFGTVGVVYLASRVLYRLLEPKEVAYEPVVLADSGWDEPADPPEVD